MRISKKSRDYTSDPTCRGPRWLEADIDMDSSGLANHVVALVKGVTTSQTIDMAIVLQVCPHTWLTSFLKNLLILEHAQELSTQ